DAGGVGAGNVGADRIADREDAPFVRDAEQLERGLVHIGQRLAVPAYSAADLLIPLGDRAAAQEELIAIGHDQIGIGAHHLETAPVRGLKHRLEILELLLAAWARIENEVGL